METSWVTALLYLNYSLLFCISERAENTASCQHYWETTPSLLCEGERDVSAVDRLPLALVQLFDGVYSTGNEWRWDSPRLTLNEKDIEALFWPWHFSSAFDPSVFFITFISSSPRPAAFQLPEDVWNSVSGQSESDGSLLQHGLGH